MWRPHLDKKLTRMDTGIEDAVIAVEQLGAGVTTDLAELVVGINNVTRQIGGADNGMLVQRKLLVGQIGQRGMQIALAFFMLLHQVVHQGR